MRVAFIHQNLPGQFRHLIGALLERGDQVLAIGQHDALSRFSLRHPGLSLAAYRLPGPAAPEALAALPELLRPFALQSRRGQAVLQALQGFAARGLRPDLIVGHPGWGEMLFLRAAFPEVPIVGYCEFYYRDRGSDVDFDPEYPPGPHQGELLQLRRAPLLLALDDIDAGLSPTEWQRAQFPAPYRPRIEVVHDGVDTDIFAPDATAEVRIGERVLRHGDPVVSFVARNLEPYRGFHVFMRCLPRLQQLAPQATVVCVGGDEVSYGLRLPAGASYRARLAQELGATVDWSRVLFSPRVPYDTHRRLLQVSAVHVHLNYPFVLSWSALEAMAAGCCVVASDTAPVREVVVDGANGLLAGFFDSAALAGRIAQGLHGGADSARLRAAARQTVLERYDLRRHCLPRQLALLDRVAAQRRC